MTCCVSYGIARARSFVCVVAGDVTVHDRGRVVPVTVVHGRRACGRGVVAVVVCGGHVVAILVACVASHVCGGVMAVTWWCDVS